MYHSQRQPPSLKRSNSKESQNSYGSAATTVSRASSKLLFGEIPLTPATTADGRSIRSNGSICNLVLSTSSVFLRFWLNDACRDNLLDHMESEDLSSFRLVCHDFSAKAAPRLFEKMTVTFKTSTFSKPARIDALSRIGRHVKTFTFHMPHGPETCLPPIIDPLTGAEQQFIYEPQVQLPQHGPAKDKAPKYGSWEMQDLLIKQYPPLFHAATNVPAFCAAFSQMINLTHLKISCPGSNSPRHRRGVVDYALISLRIAIERAPLYSLSALSLHPIHPCGLLYLHPLHNFGSTPSSAKRWSQIRHLSICMENIPSSPRSRSSHSTEHLRVLHAYLSTLSRSLTRLFFRWKGSRGPCPLSLDREPCLSGQSSKANYADESNIHPSQRVGGAGGGPTPLSFPRLRTLALENAIMDSSQIADFITRHKRSLREFNFEDVKLREGDWDKALEPLTTITGNDSWKQYQEVESMDVPVMLSPVEIAPPPREMAMPREREVRSDVRIMGPLMEEVQEAIEEVGEVRDRLAVRRGWVPPDCREAVTGKNKDKSLAETRDKSKGTVESIWKQLYGMNSYIRNLVPGEVSHEDCVVKVTNWNLAARMLGEAPTNETPQEQESQKAKFAIAAQKATLESTAVGRKASKGDRAWAGKRAQFFRKRQEERIEPLLFDAKLVSAAHTRAAILLPLFIRAKAKRAPVLQRCQQASQAGLILIDCRSQTILWDVPLCTSLYIFWSERISGADFIPSFFMHIDAFVDVVALMDNTQLMKIWNWRMLITCDLIRRYIVARDYLQHFVQRQLASFAIRSYAVVSSKEIEVKKVIFHLSRKLTEAK
ncbi:hypothetical protein A1F96_01503 [Pyrenophora tritici-repentis]|uniref:Tymo-45kd-70kd multi-domain protein n=1 Tax=Pyrenophora tritici-repentis TaxID=45151 RepID=A0A2W1HN15_9PLEO|nr:hypothetical protein A1F99_082170 [Pyrenophora tritici-repentis]KAF7569042.1 Tymo-45kd-70kd multi-domain protein [Pyrenophora tritici-repentis]KAI0576433.1 hypothetical protein Alg215_07491 [Pyrenophora tritici-repentis]KAI1508495.1 hypothetical protein Ptr86124_012447 [Pyrenophora tritici-repentis]PZD34516.1 hypothetical protein A1F96_01503 [Pyrenophora tritici-repentis]